RRGWSQDEVLKSCLSVNANAFLRSKRESEVRGIVRSAFKRKAPQSCFDALLQSYCLGPDNCAWAKRARYGERSPILLTNQSLIRTGSVGSGLRCESFISTL